MEQQETLTAIDFSGIKPSDSDVTLVADTWTKLGTYTVPKGERVALGWRYGGHYYAHFEETDDEEVKARVRIVVSDPTEYNRKVVSEFHTDQCTEGTADKKLMPYAPLIPIWVKGDSKIILEAMPTTAKVEIDNSHADHMVRIPVTMKRG